MTNLTTVELKAFVPSKAFETSIAFYPDLGFAVEWSNTDLAYIRHGDKRAWRIRDLTLHDPSGVMWRIGEI